MSADLANGVGVDLATPDNSLKRDALTGKYLYRINQNRFEIDRWNRDFEQYKDRRDLEMRRRMKEKLDQLSKPVPKVPAYNQPLGKILINTKDSLFDITDDLLQFKFTSDTLIKNDRLFYLGVLLLIISMTTFLYLMIFVGMTQKLIAYRLN